MLLLILWIKLFTDAALPGWALSLIPISFLDGVHLLSIGILGEYVTKIYLETKRRPRYFVQEQFAAPARLGDVDFTSAVATPLRAARVKRG